MECICRKTVSQQSAGEKKPWDTPSLARYGNGLSPIAVNLHMLPQNPWGTNNLMLIKSNSGQTFPHFTSSNEKTKQAPGRKLIVWAIWISKINRLEFRGASGSYGVAAQLFPQLSNRSSSHNRAALHHKPASAASTIKRFESLKGERDAWEKLMEFLTNSVEVMRTLANSSPGINFFTDILWLLVCSTFTVTKCL